jgi:hypothetical protein
LNKLAEMVYRIIIFIFILARSPVVNAGDSISSASVLINELAERPLRSPDKKFFETYLSDKGYYYGSEYQPQKIDSALERLWMRWISLLRMAMEALKIVPFVLKVIFILSCILFLYIIITKTKLYRLFYTDREVVSPDLIEVDRLDEKFDFDKAIGFQISRNNYREAIRLLHLKILRELEKYEIIKYSIDKTNRDYTREIKDGKLRSSFYILTGIYNRVWYGNYFLGREEFESFAAGFYQFSLGMDANEK